MMRQLNFLKFYWLAMIGLILGLNNWPSMGFAQDALCERFKTPNEGVYSIQGSTYSEAAFCLVNQAFQALHQDLQSDGAEIDPFEAKGLRKDILVVREMIDIFIYAFPKSQDQDDLLSLRDDLDRGYEVVGYLKDLFDTQKIEDPALAVYDTKELKEKQRPVHEWLNEFKNKKASYQALISHTLATGYADRDSKDLSFQFWGSSDRKAHAEQTTLRVIEGLLADIFSEAQDEYKIVKKIDHPAKDHERIEMYHDFRKRIRAALKLIRYFVEVPIQFQNSDLEVLTELVEKYGNVSDAIALHDRLVEKDEDKKVKDLRKEIKKDWEEIQEWEKQVEIEKALERVFSVAHDGFLPLDMLEPVCSSLLKP